MTLMARVLTVIEAQLAELWRHEPCQVCRGFGACAHRNLRRDLVELAEADPVDGWPPTQVLRKRAQRASAHRAQVNRVA